MTRIGIAAVALPIALSLASAPAGSAGIVACPDFKTAWEAALKRVDPTVRPLGFAPPAGADGNEAVTSLPGMEASLACREGLVGRVTLRGRSGGSDGGKAAEPFLKAAVATLMAFESDLSVEGAAKLLATLRADAKPGAKVVSSWAPYELTYSRSADGSRDDMVMDLVEN